MTAVLELLDRLDSTHPDNWESEYAKAQGLSDACAWTAFQTPYRSGKWLACRIEAGASGAPLPEPLVALGNIEAGNGTAIDVFSYVYQSRREGEETPEIEDEQVAPFIGRLIEIAGREQRNALFTELGNRVFASGFIAGISADRHAAFLSMPAAADTVPASTFQPFSLLTLPSYGLDLCQSYWKRAALHWLITRPGSPRYPAIPRPVPLPNVSELTPLEILRRLSEKNAVALHDQFQLFFSKALQDIEDEYNEKFITGVLGARFIRVEKGEPILVDEYVETYPTSIQTVYAAVRSLARGQALVDLQYLEAGAEFEKGLALLPKTDPLRLSIVGALGGWLASHGKPSEAIARCEQVLSELEKIDFGPEIWRVDQRASVALLHANLSIFWEDYLGDLDKAKNHIELALTHEACSTPADRKSYKGQRTQIIHKMAKRRKNTTRSKRKPAAVPSRPNTSVQSGAAQLAIGDIQHSFETIRTLTKSTAGQVYFQRVGCLQVATPVTRESGRFPEAILGGPLQFPPSADISPILQALVPALHSGAPGYVGYLAAQAHLLLFLVRHRSRERQVAFHAVQVLLANVHLENDFLVQKALLKSVADEWAQNDFGPTEPQDYPIAVTLLRRYVELCGGEAKTDVDALAALGYVLRHAPEQGQSNLREAQHLFRAVVNQCGRKTPPNFIAKLWELISDVEGQLGIGGRIERLKEAEKHIRKALLYHKEHGAEKAVALSHLAWIQTQIGFITRGGSGTHYLQVALRTFSQVNSTLLSPVDSEKYRHNKTLCEIEFRQDRQFGIQTWRSLLTASTPTSDPRWHATRQHNLGNALLFGDNVSAGEFQEGLEVSRSAAKVRTIEKDPRYHWETADNIGNALTSVLDAQRYDLLPMSVAEALREAELWFRSAADAARNLGAGEELHRVGLHLCRLASVHPSLDVMEQKAEEAWAVVREASPFLIHSQENPEQEAEAARTFAARLVEMLLASQTTPVAAGNANVLCGVDAQRVERWVVRSHQLSRRKLQARLSRPSAVSGGTWQAFQDAIHSGNQNSIIEGLEAVHKLAPSFLAEDRANDATWRWLKENEGSVAVSLTGFIGRTIVTLMSSAADDEKRIEVLVLNLPTPPYSPKDLPTRLGHKIPDQADAKLHRELVDWLRESVVCPIQDHLGYTPSTVLWNPDPYLRFLSPSALWNSVPVVTTTSLVLPELEHAPPRTESTLIVLADPGPSSTQSLGKHGDDAVVKVHRSARKLGDVQLLASRGAAFGKQDFPDISGILNQPASAEAILAEASKHKVIVIIAHGDARSTEEAALLCLDAQGNTSRLDVAAIQKTPDAFTGATVLLLSCDSGRMNEQLSEPNGVAGSLLSAGARCVVAPLWPVQLDVAEEVATDVLEGLSRGETPWQVLSKPHASHKPSSPTLGPPVGEPAQAPLQDIQRLGFVTWIG